MNRSHSPNRLVSALLLMIGLMLASLAVAGESRSDDYDRNGDGAITFEEVMQRLEHSARITFDQMDRNKDGVLSDQDFDDLREGMEKLEEWLDDLLDQFLPEEEPEQMMI